MKIKVLFVRYDKIKYPNSLEMVHSICSRILKDINIDLLTIDNSVTNDSRWLEKGIECISGDNSCFEFSAWDKGIFFTDVQNYDGILFITDAFTRSHQNYIDCFNSYVIEKAINSMAALGHIDILPEPIRLFENIGRGWMRTAFYFLPSSFVKIMGKMQSLVNPELIFSTNYQAPFLTNNFLSDNFKDYLIGWITGCGKKPWPDERWHSEFLITSDTFNFFKKKSLSIILERALTFEIIKNNYSIYDVEFLSLKSNEDYSCSNKDNMEYQSLYLLQKTINGL